jgi:hypothetical protein
MRRSCAIGIALTLVLLGAAPASAGEGFVPLPQLGGKDAGLKARFVGYQDHQVTIEVQNATRQPRIFQSAGLFFVPQGDPDKAPQRMGAAGPFEVEEQGRWRDQQSLEVAPGQTVKLRLKVFCLDSHRASPTDGQAFRLAKQRLPQSLRQDIETGATRINATNTYAPAAKGSAIQSEVWKHRNKKWIKLEGERAREQGAPPQGEQRFRHQRQMINQSNIAE